MTESEARLYLPHSIEDDLDDIFEEKLFEQKQFFLQRMPVSKLIASKVDKLKKTEEAYLFYGGEIHEFSTIEVELLPYTSEVVKDVFSVHESNKNTLKLELISAKSVKEIRLLLAKLIEITKCYAGKWQVRETAEVIKVKVSNEPDAMMLLEEITKFERLGFSAFSDLQHLLTESPLVQEANRLSLWLKLENND